VPLRPTRIVCVTRGKRLAPRLRAGDTVNRDPNLAPPIGIKRAEATMGGLTEVGDR
jgi:hypothetical protein